jgi:hypothetical protein
MNGAPMKPARNPERRRIRLVDHALQRSLLAALVLMETVLAACAIWALYQALGRAIDENLYRVHFAGNASMLSLLIAEGAPVLAAMLGVNLAALIVADRIWAWYVDGILGDLGGLMDATRRLDFSAQASAHSHHAVLEQASGWRAAEAAHLAALRARIAGLPPQLPPPGPQRAAIAAVLASVQE